MWTLLWESARLNGFHDTGKSGAHPNRPVGYPGRGDGGAARHEREGESRNGAARGENLAAPQPTRRSEVRIYMHPGRMAVGVMDFERVGEQFDLQRAELFATLEDAEPACAGRTGFLLELREGATGAAVFFVESLRS
jgi:hypothetical protein